MVWKRREGRENVKTPERHGFMSDGTSEPDGSDGFNEALAELVFEAFLSGVDVKGAWDISKTSEEGTVKFTVEIYQLDG